MNHTTLHQSVREWSEGLNVPEQVEGQRLEENQRWYVRCDGCRTNSLDGWKEVKVGCVYRDYPQCGSDAVPGRQVFVMLPVVLMQHILVKSYLR